MREWIIIVASGGLGGIAGTLFTERVVPSRASARDTQKPAGIAPYWLQWLLNLALNVAGGALAAFVLWATYTSSLTFDSRAFTPSEVAAAITVGFGGVGAVRGLMNISQQAETWRHTAERSAEAADELGDAPSDDSEESMHA